MKNLTKILGLLAMMTLVSCGSGSKGSPSLEEAELCINGDEAACEKIVETPVAPVVEELEFLVENFASVEFNNITTTFFDVGHAGGTDFIRFRATGSAETGLGHVAFVEVALFENGVAWITTTISNETVARESSWSITSDDELILDGKTETVTLKEAI